MNRYVGNLPPMTDVFPDYPAPVIRNAGDAEEMVLMRWGMPPPPRVSTGYARGRLPAARDRRGTQKRVRRHKARHAIRGSNIQNSRLEYSDLRPKVMYFASFPGPMPDLIP
jgi:putative SOS response-associated peptidase YedK